MGEHNFLVNSFRKNYTLLFIVKFGRKITPVKFMLCLKLVSHMGVWLFFGILFLSGEVPTKDNSSLKPSSNWVIKLILASIVRRSTLHYSRELVLSTPS